MACSTRAVSALTKRDRRFRCQGVHHSGQTAAMSSDAVQGCPAPASTHTTRSAAWVGSWRDSTPSRSRLSRRIFRVRTMIRCFTSDSCGAVEQQVSAISRRKPAREPTICWDRAAHLLRSRQSGSRRLRPADQVLVGAGRALRRCSSPSLRREFAAFTTIS